MRANRTKEKGCGKRADLRNLTGSQIRLFRKKRGWTQHQLAESFRKIGVPITRDMIANIETQRCTVADYQIVFFARVLGVSWKSLFPDKTILEAFTATDFPKQQLEQKSDADKTKRAKRNSSMEVSRKKWNICEMTCKSIKVVFRAPS